MQRRIVLKKKKRKVVDIIQEIAEERIKDTEFEIVDIEFVKEGPHRYLRVYLDKDGGVSLDDCKFLSEYINERLDKLDPIEENYFLEVSSPGIERALKKDSDFEKFAGKLVELKLYFPLDGQKIIEGELMGLQNGKVRIKPENQEAVIAIPKDKIALAKLLVRF